MKASQIVLGTLLLVSLICAAPLVHEQPFEIKSDAKETSLQAEAHELGWLSKWLADPNSKKSAAFTHAFVGSLSMIIVSELGDKTFFIAAIMAMRHSRATIFAGGLSALALMTVLSAYIGAIASFIPRIYTHWIGTMLFLIFGLRLLREAYCMSENEAAEELEEVTQELKAKEEELSAKEASLQRPMISPVFVQAFVLTFLAEWGDRSQIATIILGAKEDPLAVSAGAVLGHALCTFIAVVGGRLLAQRISIKTVTYIGGVVFLLFAMSSILLEDVDDAPVSLDN